MSLDDALSRLPPADWIVEQVIIFDWCDFPKEGIVAMSRPRCEFYFSLVAERNHDDTTPTGLFRLSELPVGSVGEVLAIIRPLGVPKRPVWIPIWKFSSQEEGETARRQIDFILDGRSPATSIVSSPDLFSFGGHWRIDPAEPAPADWFARLGVK